MGCANSTPAPAAAQPAKAAPAGHIVASKAAKEGGKTVLVIASSPMGPHSATNNVAKAFCDAYAEAFPDDGIRVLDLCGAGAPPPFSAVRAQSKFKTFEGADAADAVEEWQATKKIIEDFKSADKYVILAPMWNLHIPYVLKQYLDHLVQPHLTFSIPDMKGCVTGKPALIIRAAGGVPVGCPMDCGTAYLKAVLGFIGFTDVRLLGITGTANKDGLAALLAERSAEAKALATKFSFDEAAAPAAPEAPEVPQAAAAEVKAGAKVLHVTSSCMGEMSATGRASAGLLTALKEKDSSVEVTDLNLFECGLKPFEALRVQGKFATWGGGKDFEIQDAAAKKEWDYTKALIEQFKAADVYVFDVPMWNLFAPYTFKQYLDHIVQPHQTFNPATNSGLLEGKRAFVVAASGNGLLGSPVDHITPYMKNILGFMGVTDVSYTFVNGTAGPDSDAAVNGAIESLKSLACL